MPNRYNGREPDNIRNTDDEDTMLLPGGIENYSEPRSSLPPLKKVNRRSNTPTANKPSTAQAPAPQFPHTEQPPQFPKTQQPPQFPQSSAPPTQQQFDYSDRRYYDYNRESPQQHGSQPAGGYAPPPPPVAPAAPQPQPSGRKRPSSTGADEPPKKKKKKRRHKSLAGRIIRRLLHIVLILFLLLFGIYSCTSVCLIRKVNQQPTGRRNHYADSVGRGYVRNVLVIGTDGRTSEDRGRSDSMILVSLNRKTNEIVMTSFMRDCYVEIPDNGWNKLNAAYAFGGPELLMDTIEYNFDVRIDDYVSVDFVSFASVVDAVGGIDIEVSDAEAEEINVILISEVNEIMGDDRNADLLSGGGKLHLNGKQALSYSRIRKVGNSDFERTERQRRVMSLILAKLKTCRPSMFKNLASDVIPDVSTNMTGLKMYLLSLRLPLCMGYDTKQVQIPAEGTYYGADVDVGNVLQVDFEENKKVIDSEVFAQSK
ncbi:LCP family protein [uncultured Ruminococcus sp.]|uniref:LCP family protein n=1 Tax=uncultured Ruminococcus sp. TaxID=165186 RepID=UPI00262541C5|nr:LCP family protein [uncultured Ruminococcus sp.]